MPGRAVLVATRSALSASAQMGDTVRGRAGAPQFLRQLGIVLDDQDCSRTGGTSSRRAVGSRRGSANASGRRARSASRSRFSTSDFATALSATTAVCKAQAASVGVTDRAQLSRVAELVSVSREPRQRQARRNECGTRAPACSGPPKVRDRWRHRKVAPPKALPPRLRESKACEREARVQTLQVASEMQHGQQTAEMGRRRRSGAAGRARPVLGLFTFNTRGSLLFQHDPRPAPTATS